MKFFLIAIIIGFSSIIHAVRIELEKELSDKCDYSKCPKECWENEKLIVHLVPHTHDDVGWLKTVDQYYYGTKQWIQNAGVQYILDTVIDELIHNKQRKFIYVETAYFWKWWQEQDEQMRSIVRELVRTGQLEFINGGWTMPDEANTYYQSLIDQYTLGLEKLNETFGYCGWPRVTWQIDPFGHSRELASLFAQMGYDALYFAREDYQDRINRELNQTLEHVWQGSDDLGKWGDIFTGMMQMGYGPPKGLDWDIVGGEDDAIVDNIESKEYNVPKIIKKFRSLAKSYSYYYATNHIMFPMGTDFNYQSAHQWYKNMDKLIKIINSDDDVNSSNIRIVYSTPSCYTKALHNCNRTWTTKTDDYFPYASDPHAYWTGYYTSRPSLKRMERVGNQWLQVCKQLDAIAGNEPQRFKSNITRLREAMAVLQHHDAVAGTAKQHVTNDYARLLHDGIVQCQSVISESFVRIAKNFGLEFHSNVEQIEYCNNLNHSTCPLTESGKSFIITIYNPLAHSLINYTIRLPVNDRRSYQVFDSKQQSIPAVLVPKPDWIKELSDQDEQTKHYDSNVEIVFKVNLDPLAIQTFTVKSSYQSTTDQSSARLLKGKRINNTTVLNGKNFRLIFDKYGQIESFDGENFGKVLFRNNFRYYEGAVGDNKVDNNRSSGAYIFRPKEQQTKSYGHVIEALYYNDNIYGIVQEIHQRFDTNVGQIIRLTSDSKFIEFDFVVGPISIQDNIGKEIIVQYQTNQTNNGIFYTDANGRQLIKRQWNYRSTWPYKVEEPISGNYYPVNSRFILFTDYQNISVLTDRSEGGTNPTDGMIELMVHRRLLHDDGFGVDEALNETGIDGNGLVIRCRHRFLLLQHSYDHRMLSQEFQMEPIMAFTAINNNNNFKMKNKWNILNDYSFVSKSLPSQIHLLTLEQWSYDRLLLRLENYLQHVDSPDVNDVEIDLRKLFNTTFIIVDYEEMTLAANQPIENLKNRLNFHYKSSNYEIKSDESIKSNPMIIRLKPMQIRTFLLRINRK